MSLKKFIAYVLLIGIRVALVVCIVQLYFMWSYYLTSPPVKPQQTRHTFVT